MTFDRVQVLRETPKAILAWFDDYSADEWVPKSHLCPGSVRFQGDAGNLVVSTWCGRKLEEALSVREETATRKAYERGLREGFALGSLKAPQTDALAAGKIYRKLVGKYHPDRNGGDAEIMKDINELWQSMRSGA